MREIPYLVYKSEYGIRFDELFSKTCNGSPASAKIYSEAIVKLIALKEIEAIGENGEKRRSQIMERDMITKPKQSDIFIIF